MLFTIFSLGLTPQEIVINLCIYLAALLFSFSVHEYMHAWTAYKCGDDTAKMLGRLNLRPTSHIDPMGFAAMMLMGFGWAKPVPINPNKMTRFKKRETSVRFVSLAGVASNFVIAFAANLILIIAEVLIRRGGVFANSIPDAEVSIFFPLRFYAAFTFGEILLVVLLVFLLLLIEINLVLMAFNLLPIPPLDGYRFVSSFLPLSIRAKIENRMNIIYFVFVALMFSVRFTGVNVFTEILAWMKMPARYVFGAVADLIFRLLG